MNDGAAAFVPIVGVGLNLFGVRREHHLQSCIDRRRAIY